MLVQSSLPQIRSRSGSSNRTVLQTMATLFALFAFGRAFRKEKVEGESPSHCTSRGSRMECMTRKPHEVVMTFNSPQ
jgi:hypothetical protein